MNIGADNEDDDKDKVNMGMRTTQGPIVWEAGMMAHYRQDGFGPGSAHCLSGLSFVKPVTGDLTAEI